MSETKTYVFGNDGNRGYQNGFDPNFLIGAMMGGGGGFGGLGGGNWLFPLLWIALFGNNGWGGFGGNGGYGNLLGTGFLSNQINENAGKEVIMQALQGTNSAIDQLASTFNCTAGEMRNALTSINNQICGVGNQLGMTGMQVINAIDRGDAAIASQLANCCCSIEKGILESNYLTERGFCNTNQILTKGFSDLGYATAQQTCDISKSIEASTSRILEGQRAAELRELNREITERDRRIAEQSTAINNYQQTQTFGAMINQATAPIAAAVNNLQSDVDGIKCKLPRTETVVAQPNYIPVNYGVNVGLAPYSCGCGFGLGYGYGNGFANGGSLWG